MLSLLMSDPLLFLLYMSALVVAITIHEFAHARAADVLGDPTPRHQGRVSLNPARHLDPIGVLFLLIAGFGWGRPVQFDPFNLKNPRRDAAIISFAGPLSNIMLAILLALVLQAVKTPLLYPFIHLNVTLAIFNLIPVHPLDGFKIVGGFLSAERAHEWYQLERYGFIFLLALILPIHNGMSMISWLISPRT
jgi:Zn-dependent protease